ncbi:hypothetical protein ACWEOO_06680 [Kribbella sp. NPDC004138]
MGIETPRTVTRTELLDIREGDWRRRVEVVSLAAEVFDQIDRAHREQALAALGHLYKRQPGAAERVRLLRRWPSVFVLTMAGVAADHYERGIFWPKLASLLGISNEQVFHAEWGEAFLANLRRLRLPTFDDGDGDAGSKYVGRILIHAGMPTYCLGDFFKILTYKRSVVTGLTPEAFVSWAATRAAGVGFQNVDVPVQRFLRYGREFAVDVADRAFDLVDAVASGVSGEDVPLPARYRAAARRFHQERGITPRRDGGAVLASGDVQPQLIVDPFDQGVLLRLPPVGDAPDGQAVWRVDLDGETRRVPTQALWPGSGEPAPSTDVAIDSPVRSASVALDGHEHLRVVFPVINDADPLLAFGEDGVLLPPGLPVPARPTWLLFPGEPSSLEVVGEAAELSESPLPPGWAGWCLLQLDLRLVRRLSVGGSDRVVRDRASARIEIDAPLRGVRTSTGHEIVPSIPRIRLPEQLEGAEWEVELLDATGRQVARWKSTDGGAAGPHSIWDVIPRPVVGTFTVRVRGPWGRGATRTVTVMEGLRAAFNPPWRRFTSSGLQPCHARLTLPSNADGTSASIDFAEHQRERYVRLGTRDQSRTLVVMPPHMSVSYQSSETVTNPSIRPLRLAREEIIEQPGSLILNLDADAEPKLHVITSAGALQVVEPLFGRAGVFHFKLARVVDTLTANPQAKLALGADGSLVVATVSPRQLVRRIIVDDGVLELADCVDVEGLTALVYATRAPWRPPAIIPVTDGRAPLPECLVDGGPLRVLVRVDDPWAPLPVPVWPEGPEVRFVEADGYILDDDAESSALSAFLAGLRDFPSPIEDFTRLWSVRGLLVQLGVGSRIDDIAHAIDMAVHKDPRRALLALTSSQAPTDAIPNLIVRAHLAWANLKDAHDDQAPEWSMRGALPAALLSGADAEWSADEVEAAIGVCGEMVSELLGGSDRFATAGRLDAAADIFDREPVRREEFVRQAGLIPQGLLSAESRVIAAMQLVKERRDRRLDWSVRNAHTILVEADRMIRMLGDPVAKAAFAARRHLTATGGWRVIPSISLGFALAARSAARGNELAGGWLDRRSRVWTALATVVPQLVTIDLVLAELLTASSVTSKSQETKQ